MTENRKYNFALLATELYDKGDYSQVIELCEEGISNYPQFISGYALLAQSKCQLNGKEDANDFLMSINEDNLYNLAYNKFIQNLQVNIDKIAQKNEGGLKNKEYEDLISQIDETNDLASIDEEINNEEVSNEEIDSDSPINDIKKVFDNEVKEDLQEANNETDNQVLDETPLEEEESETDEQAIKDDPVGDLLNTFDTKLPESEELEVKEQEMSESVEIKSDEPLITEGVKEDVKELDEIEKAFEALLGDTLQEANDDAIVEEVEDKPKSVEVEEPLITEGLKEDIGELDRLEKAFETLIDADSDISNITNDNTDIPEEDLSKLSDNMAKLLDINSTDEVSIVTEENSQEEEELEIDVNNYIPTEMGNSIIDNILAQQVIKHTEIEEEEDDDDGNFDNILNKLQNTADNKQESKQNFLSDDIDDEEEGDYQDFEMPATEDMAEILESQENYQEAISIYEKLIPLYPEKTNVYQQKIEYLNTL